MTTNNIDLTLVPNKKEVAAAAASHVQLASALSTEKQMQRFEIWDDGQRQHTVQLPTLVLRLLDRVLAELAMGNAVRIAAIRPELTLIEAADLLDVSRLRLVELLEQNAIPYTKIGRRSRVKTVDVMAFKQRQTVKSRQAMDELSKQAQALGLGYERGK